MNREMLTLYGLKWNPFSTDLPVDGLMTTPAVENFCRRVERHLVRQGGFALIGGPPGIGKSVALRLLAERLERIDRLSVAVLTHPSSSVADFYHEISDRFAITMAHNNRWNGIKDCGSAGSTTSTTRACAHSCWSTRHRSCPTRC